jgi:hypothetical protein
LAFYNVKYDFFAIANGAKKFFWIIFDDCRLMNEDIFIRIVTMNKSISVADIEPFYLTGDRCCKNLSVKLLLGVFVGHLRGITGILFGVRLAHDFMLVIIFFIFQVVL